jgi:poly(3-hydroxybutyrate) depolymerase
MKTTFSTTCWPAMKRLTYTCNASALMGLLLASGCSSDTNSSGTSNPTRTAGAGVTGTVTAGTGTGVAGRSVAGSNSTITTGAAGASTLPPTGAAGVRAPGGNPGDVQLPQAGVGAAGKGAAGATATAGVGGAPAAAGAGGSTGTTTGTPTKSPGCGMAPPAAGSDTSIMVGSAKGTLIVDLPKNYDSNKAYPLILVWHGFNVTAPMFHDYLNVHAAVGDDGIVVTPECLDGGTMWPTDMAYPDALVEHFEAKYCVDKSRVFTTGHSMGGMYTGQIGCQRGDVFRGDAVLAAPHPTGACKKGTMAAMMSVGMSDPVATGTTEFAWWAMENGCNASMTTPVDPMSFYTKALDESGTCIDYGGCGSATPLRTCTFMGGHEIPPWVAGAVWNFFKKL